ncbi:hypothetical protein [Actinomadura madurae]|nr:hypothetical protein [Actinomadura madurae]MCP9950532.1 hypothetical protein [Actinomadura madurae]MCP9967314.1 hypothetical protein [Actinomadura madurae]MCP9979771.1 hypothetical protein [Actinomadura madurae]MCQ0008697.1 hypothetical protein [Actinomadura madurae]MCQ0015979.1 hypothetical protein [Actinomadura madurae]
MVARPSRIVVHVSPGDIVRLPHVTSRSPLDATPPTKRPMPMTMPSTP